MNMAMSAFAFFLLISATVSGKDTQEECKIQCDDGFGDDITELLQQSLLNCEKVTILQNSTCGTLPVTIPSNTIL